MYSLNLKAFIFYNNITVFFTDLVVSDLECFDILSSNIPQTYWFLSC